MHKNTSEDLLKKHGNTINEYDNKMSFCENFNIKDISVKSFEVYHKDKNIPGAFGLDLSHTTNKMKYKVNYI